MKSKIRSNIQRFLFEFVIVTLGILSAFSINKWDENRKLRTEEVVSYVSLKKDLTSDLYVFNHYKQPLIKARTYLKPILEKNYGDIDSLVLFMGTTFDFQEGNATYNNLKFSGKLDLLNNSKIKRKIILYYETYYQGIENMSRWNYDFRLHFLQPFLLEKMKYNPDKDDLLENLNNDAFLNLINSQYQLIEYNLSTIEKSENLIHSIIKEIDTELNNE